MIAEGSSQDPLGKRKRACDDEDDEEDLKFIVPSTSYANSDEGDSDSDDSDESNDDGEERDDEEITGECEYNESDEAFPRRAAYDKDFTQVGIDLTTLPKEAIALVDRSGCNSTRAANCRDDADDLVHIPRAKREKACLLGNTGAGKSSLLNALLGTPNLAKAMAGGQSCTYVGTEYESPFPGQTKKFAAKVEYFDIKAIEELLKRLLTDYNIWEFDRPEDCDDEEMQQLKRRSTTAFSTFRSLFCNQDEFESPRAGREYLESCYNDEFSDALGAFVVWCKELLEEKEADEADHTEYLDADSQQELLDQLDPLVSSNSRLEQPTLWPLVKNVKIGIEGPRILDYIILVDLPGIDDTNQVRVRASYQMMQSCDSIWVIAKIDRAITDSAVDSLLMKYGRSKKMIVVCTGIDDNIDPALAAFLESEGQSVGNHGELLMREKQLRKVVKNVPKKIETRRAKLEGRNKSRAKKKPKPLTEKVREKLIGQIAALEAQLKDAEQELPAVAHERFELLVDARNSNTIRRLEDEKSDHLPLGEGLKVFCVSNVHYSALKGARVINGPRLSAEMTGIPPLRTFVLECAAPNIERSVEDYITHKFTVFMKGLKMWTSSYSVEGGHDLLAVVQAAQNKIGSGLFAYHDNLDSSNQEINVKVLEESREEIVVTATTALEKRRKWHWSTTRSFIRNDGNHATTIVPEQCWNDHFLEGVKNVMREQWDCFSKKQEELGGTLMTDLIDLVQGVWDAVNAHPAHMVLPMDQVDELFRAELNGIKQACREHQHESKKELELIKTNTKDECPTGYFTEAMKEAYEKAQADRGSGVKKRTFNTFDTYLTLGGTRSPFAFMCNELSAAISNDAKQQNRALLRRVEHIFKNITCRFEDMIDRKIVDPNEEKLRREFRTYLETAEMKFADIKGDLARIKRRYE